MITAKTSPTGTFRSPPLVSLDAFVSRVKSNPKGPQRGLWTWEREMLESMVIEVVAFGSVGSGTAAGIRIW